MDNEAILKRVEEKYQGRGWSVYRLSKESGIHQSTLSSIFKNRSTISLSNLEKICRALKIPLSQFFAELEGGARAKTGGRAMEIANEFSALSDQHKRLLQIMVTTMAELDKREE